MEARTRRLIVLLLILLLLLLAAVSVRAITPEQWREDLVILRAAIAAHPDPFRKTSKAAIDQAADALAAELPTLQDYQAVARMVALVAMLGDGHSRLRLPMAEGADLLAIIPIIRRRLSRLDISQFA